MNRKATSRPNKHFFTEWRFRREEVESPYSSKVIKISIRFLSQSRDRYREIYIGRREEKIDTGLAITRF